MSDLPFIGREDERSQKIGGRAAMLAYTALSALLLAIIVMHIIENGFTNLGAIRLEIAGFVLGWIVYFGAGLYYTRKM
ncbi:hypothetical protein [Halorubrum laminariae]|uniref:DUF2178 domain-containing protein n=1 Tax=Halorubrum laminariae TaxID=1433523 RepID=A0ABD6C0T5_9EURY|nr:hypothetical protein [Halorubrum laminariae]